MISIGVEMKVGNITIRDNTMAQMVKYFDQAHEVFAKAALKVHRKTVLEILVFLIRVAPVVTGRLRASFTPFLDKLGKQNAYARYLNDRSIAKSAPKSALGRVAAALSRVLEVDAISEGKALGFYQDGNMITVLGTNVVYADSANNKSHYFDLAMTAGTYIANFNFEDFVKAAIKAGWIPDDKQYDDTPVQVVN